MTYLIDTEVLRIARQENARSRDHHMSAALERMNYLKWIDEGGMVAFDWTDAKTERLRASLAHHLAEYGVYLRLVSQRTAELQRRGVEIAA